MFVTFCYANYQVREQKSILKTKIFSFNNTVTGRVDLNTVNLQMCNVRANSGMAIRAQVREDKILVSKN